MLRKKEIPHCFLVMYGDILCNFCKIFLMLQSGGGEKTVATNLCG